MRNEGGTVVELVIPVDQPTDDLREPLTTGLTAHRQLAYRTARGDQEARRCRASQALRSLRRSSSEVPPQMPDSWLVARANSRQELGFALRAHRLGRVDLLDRRTGAADREEEVGVGVTAGRLIAPVVDVPLDIAAPGEGHATLPLSAEIVKAFT